MRAREERRKDKERKRRADQCHREWVEKKKQESKMEREEKEVKKQEERLQASEVRETEIKYTTKLHTVYIFIVIRIEGINISFSGNNHAWTIFSVIILSDALCITNQ